jgi:hypothetical protein
LPAAVADAIDAASNAKCHRRILVLSLFIIASQHPVASLRTLPKTETPRLPLDRSLFGARPRTQRSALRSAPLTAFAFSFPALLCATGVADILRAGQRARSALRADQGPSDDRAGSAQPPPTHSLNSFGFSAIRPADDWIFAGRLGSLSRLGEDARKSAKQNWR